MDDPVLIDDLRPSKSPPASVYDDMFESYFNRATEPPEPSPKASSASSTPPPVFDKPVFDDDLDAIDPYDAIPLFGGGGSGGGGEEDFLGDPVGSEKSEGKREPESWGFDDDLLPGLGGSSRSTEPVRDAMKSDQEAVSFDDLIPEFGWNTKPEPPVKPEEVIPAFVGSTSRHILERSGSFLLPNFQFSFVLSIKLDYHVEGEGGLPEFEFCCSSYY